MQNPERNLHQLSDQDLDGVISDTQRQYAELNHYYKDLQDERANRYIAKLLISEEPL